MNSTHEATTDVMDVEDLVFASSRERVENLF
jgi:hypothetical protein